MTVGGLESGRGGGGDEAEAGCQAEEGGEAHAVGDEVSRL